MDIQNKYGMRDMHIALHQMLEDFDAICSENCIIYSLGFGSMLGAVREHGIIPWDDDIDILIDRSNYSKLKDTLVYSKVFALERNYNNAPWLPRFRYKDKMSSQFGYELTIDIFIIDNVPESNLGARIKLLTVLLLQGMLKKEPTIKKGSLGQKFASIIAFIIGKLLPLSIKLQLFDRISQISNNKHTLNCACYNAEFLYSGRKYDGRLLNDIVRVDFDGGLFPVSNYYDSYLTSLYGNWRIPPSIENRVTKHS